jgi:predicted nucleic acid-binding protein
MVYLLDSTVLIDCLRGRPVVAGVRAMRDTGDVPATTGINVEEVVRGPRPKERPATRRLFEVLRIFSIRAEEGWRAGEWRRGFASRGVTLSQADRLIAAAAAARRAILATGNPDDFPMRGRRLEHWPVCE